MKKLPGMVVRGLEVGPFMSNCYIVGSEKTKEGMVVDPGADGGDILAHIKELGLKIKYLVATHGHIDHISAVKEVKEATGAEFVVHQEEAKGLHSGNYLSAVFGISFPSPPPPDRLVQGGDSLEMGDLKFLVLHTPGHSFGGICLSGPGVVFSGDTLFNQGIGRFDFPGGDYKVLLNSIHTKLLVLPDETIVYPGHGPETTIGFEKKYNPFLREQLPY